MARSFLCLAFILFAFFQNGSCSLFNRSSFPPGFMFGVGSAAYQYEGAARADGKGPSIWDTFTHKHADRIPDHSNGDVAEDFYYRYKEDIQRVKKLGMDSFRLSISWPRILPKGKLSGGINKKGIDFYNNVFNELLANGIQPFVTIFHWDLPQALEDEYKGFLSERIVQDYVDYVNIVFKEFGDRIKYWNTFNEPYIYCSMGYTGGSIAPGRCSSWEVNKCEAGNSGTEPYIAAHNMLLAHSAAVKLYKDKYQKIQKGQIGITLVSHWFLPYSNSKTDVAAVQRSLDFMFGWFMDPLHFGEYPASMREILGNRLPKFTKQQAELLKGSYDFVGINYYATNYAKDNPVINPLRESFQTDSRANLTGVRNGLLLGPQPVKSAWFYIYPPGIRNLMLYTKVKYNNPIIYITENGVTTLRNDNLTLHEELADDIRIEYHRNHLLNLNRAIKEGADVRGYYVWNIMDDFEWSSGFTHRFGLFFVNFNDKLKRYPKRSAHWFTEFLKK
ncbi:hypothetical protein LUZ60_003373 [Juncus effusus]|nr:hypothetical protein LUZ60_003373 [Juncus effusus]